MQLQLLYYLRRHLDVRHSYRLNIDLLTLVCSNSPEEDNPLKWTKGSPEETAKYEWNSKQVTWHFCQTCGAILIWKGFGCIGVNARCLDEFAKLDLKTIKLDTFDGANQIPGDPPAKLQRAGKHTNSMRHFL